MIYQGHRFLRVPNLTVSLDEALMRQIKAHPGVNWSEAAREGIRRKMQEIHIWDQLLADSEVTEQDVARIAAEVNEAVAKRYRDLVDDNAHRG